MATDVHITGVSMNHDHCDCIKTPGGIRGFGAWCKDHHRLLDDYEFQKAKADEVVRRYGELEARNQTLQSALLSLLPGLVLDRRYADADDDIDALNSRIETVQEALYPTAPQREVAK